jgi:hypothetical protein
VKNVTEKLKFLLGLPFIINGKYVLNIVTVIKGEIYCVVVNILRKILAWDGLYKLYLYKESPISAEPWENGYLAKCRTM